ncbi:hypothetical protein [Rhizobium azibense]|uniref:Uncharacterized protein n=1 Tax=Rhizobium azibense TaxID=1136135 RepID=A0A4R3RHI6_9HYPH|nr:hypothetical protein [Rhizobium azibense]TCU34124.1 hypothetical protein EV129_113108 [Rhizobium azibense]
MMNELIAEAKGALGLRSVWIDDEEYEKIINAVLAKVATYDDNDSRTLAIASSARLNRLLRICREIKWNDLGEPAMKANSTKAAMYELACFVLQDALAQKSASAS